MIIIIIIAILLFSCNNDFEKGTSIKTYIDNVIYGNPVRIEISQNDIVSIKINSDTLHQYNKGNTILFGGVYADLFDKNGLKTSELHSDTAIVFNNSDSVKAIGNVLIESIKGFKLYTEEIILYNKTKLIKSTENIMFTSNTDTLYGIGFWSNFDMTNSQIQNPKGLIGNK